MKLCFYKLIINNFLLKYKSDKISLFLNKKKFNWGLGIGDWGFGDWGWGPIPNPQYPIPIFLFKNNAILIDLYFNKKLLIINL